MTRSLLSTRLTPLLMMFLALFTLVFQGCGGGGGGGGGASNTDPSGYYRDTGSANVDDGASGMITEFNDLQGLVSPDGKLMMLSVNTGVAYVGTYTVSGSAFTGLVDVYEAGVMTQKDVPIINGMITQGTTMTGDLDGTGRAAKGSFTLEYAEAMDNGPVELDQVYHELSWKSVNNSENFNLSIEEEVASIPNFGSNGTGLGTFDNCKFGGRIEPISNTHLYTLSGTMRDCLDSNSFSNGILVPDAYSGLVSVRGIDPDDRLIVVLTNGAYGIIGEYRR
ncbi:MAG: hypothetical protein L3J98_06135 [Gammaproteobacteria bacterium]|nr:hypothetical protein [Gammaproteobacteria bacterium]MCF6259725.1 hypothetical protein [Gammaproteobacteria bacterium]